MVVRRIREHAAAHNWFAVAIDLVVVGIGVFLGIEAANWNQRRAERAEAQEYRSLIVDNLRANEADITARVAYYRQVRGHAVAALEAIQSPGSRRGEQFLIDAYQASQGWFRPLQRAAYEEPVEISVRRMIGDVRTRSELAAWYQQASGFDSGALSVTRYRDRLRSEMDLRVQLAIRGECDDVMRDIPGGGQAPVLPDSCDLDLDPQLVERASRQLAASPGLDKDLNRLIVDIDQKLGVFARALRSTQSLRARLDPPQT